MRVAIVNDSPLAVEALRRILKAHTTHELAWVAGTGREAVERCAADKPDLVLMDLIMPGMDGVEATRRIMAATPCAIMVVTASVSTNLSKVYEAMGSGALDAVSTPTVGGIMAPGGVESPSVRALLDKLAVVERLIGVAARGSSSTGEASPAKGGAMARPPLVAVGASTGGPQALATVLEGLPKAFAAAVVLIQHVDSDFAPGLAIWLRERTGRHVELARDGDRPAPGRVWLAATQDHLVLRQDRTLGYTRDPVDCPYRPSVDAFFASAASHWPEAGVAVLLTGMGRDGAKGMGRLRQLGWLTIAQDQATSVVYGMPKAAVDLGACRLVMGVHEVASAVAGHVEQLTHQAKSARR